MGTDSSDLMVMCTEGCIGVYGVAMYSLNCQQLALLAVNQTLSKSNKVELALLCLGTGPTSESFYFFHIFLHVAPQACAVATTRSSKNELCESVLTFYLISIREMIYPSPSPTTLLVLAVFSSALLRLHQ